MGKPEEDTGEQQGGRSRDELLLRLLKTPPQPRPKRERARKSTAKRKPKKEAPTK